MARLLGRVGEVAMPDVLADHGKLNAANVTMALWALERLQQASASSCKDGDELRGAGAVSGSGTAFLNTMDAGYDSLFLPQA